MQNRRSRIVASAFLALLVGAVAVHARPRTLRQFVSTYAHTTKTKLDNCVTCHTPAGELNLYGTALKSAGLAFEKVEKLDSDKDGSSNIAEIKALKFPGDPKDKPGGKAHSDSTVIDTLLQARSDSAGVTLDSLRASPDTTGAEPDTSSSPRPPR